jgi:hypothetical protein
MGTPIATHRHPATIADYDMSASPSYEALTRSLESLTNRVALLQNAEFHSPQLTTRIVSLQTSIESIKINCSHLYRKIRISLLPLQQRNKNATRSFELIYVSLPIP